MSDLEEWLCFDVFATLLAGSRRSVKRNRQAEERDIFLLSNGAGTPYLCIHSSTGRQVPVSSRTLPVVPSRHRSVH